MSDKIAEAAAMLPDAPSNAVEAEVSEPTVEPNAAAIETPVSETPEGPSASELRKLALKEQLESLRDKRSKSKLEKERAEFEASRKKFEAEKAELEARRGKFARMQEDPRAAAEDLGIDVRDYYDKMTKAVLEEDTPDHKLAKAIAPLRKELDELRAFREEHQKAQQELAELKEFHKTLTSQQKQAQRAQVEAAFDGELQKVPHFSKLSKLYGKEQLTRIGDATADALITELGRAPTLTEVAHRVNSDFDRAYKVLREGDEPPPVTAQPTTITNALASSSGTASAAAKPKTRAERLKEAQEELGRQLR